MTTTSTVADGHRTAHRRQLVNHSLVPAAALPHADGPFTGQIITAHVGALRVVTVEADAQRVKRTASHIAQSPEPLVALSVQTTGRTELIQDGRLATVNEGDLFVHQTSRPYVLDHPERYSTRTVYIPRDMLALSETELSSVSGRAIATNQGCAAILKPLLTTVVSSAHLYSPPAASGLANGLIDLFSTLVTEQIEESAAGTGPTRNHLVQRVREYIDVHLADPALSPESVARAHHISVRYLHRLFETEGITIGRLIRQRRLEECARDLVNQSRTAPTVSAIAQRWGFINPTHFSRVFRNAYGLSPAKWRTTRLEVGRATYAGRTVHVVPEQVIPGRPDTTTTRSLGEPPGNVVRSGLTGFEVRPCTTGDNENEEHE
ncbi:helix-turn-helix domain-containing protein [Streptomyces atroolivaceus]|uniref:Helix-turn-helix domain-containing protein n=1 Tax=Streptomyces atroolivaceus TaxID=66869 RepID=A0ABV9VH10_STRAZ|nr:helix-turn-helix domain-containing protein [Streptomyces atroolivaceus]